MTQVNHIRQQIYHQKVSHYSALVALVEAYARYDLYTSEKFRDKALMMIEGQTEDRDDLFSALAKEAVIPPLDITDIVDIGVEGEQDGKDG